LFGQFQVAGTMLLETEIAELAIIAERELRPDQAPSYAPLVSRCANDRAEVVFGSRQAPQIPLRIEKLTIDSPRDEGPSERGTPEVTREPR
jgi:hypothetical protein